MGLKVVKQTTTIQVMLKKVLAKLLAHMDKVNQLKLMTAETATVAITHQKTVVDQAILTLNLKKFNFF